MRDPEQQCTLLRYGKHVIFIPWSHGFALPLEDTNTSQIAQTLSQYKPAAFALDGLDASTWFANNASAITRERWDDDMLMLYDSLHQQDIVYATDFTTLKARQDLQDQHDALIKYILSGGGIMAILSIIDMVKKNQPINRREVLKLLGSGAIGYTGLIKIMSALNNAVADEQKNCQFNTPLQMIKSLRDDIYHADRYPRSKLGAKKIEDIPPDELTVRNIDPEKPRPYVFGTGHTMQSTLSALQHDVKSPLLIAYDLVERDLQFMVENHFSIEDAANILTELYLRLGRTLPLKPTMDDQGKFRTFQTLPHPVNGRLFIYDPDLFNIPFNWTDIQIQNWALDQMILRIKPVFGKN